MLYNSGKKVEFVFQTDGANDSSSSSDSNSSEESDKDDEEEEQGEEEKSLNSEDDVSEEDPGSVFDVENLVVCLYDKVILKHFYKYYNFFLFILDKSE